MYSVLSQIIEDNCRIILIGSVNDCVYNHNFFKIVFVGGYRYNAQF